MRKGLLFIMLLGWLFGPASVVQNATEAYNAKKYADAATGFTAGLEDYTTQHPAINFNIGQSWLALDSTAKAITAFGKTTNAAKEAPQMGSWAWNNLGCMFANAQQPAQGGMPMQAQGSMPGSAMPPQAQGGGGGMNPLEHALQAFKDALKLDHDNELARYNYELIKRKIQQQQQQQQDQNQDQQQQDQQQDQQQQDQQKQKGQDQQNDKPENQENKGNQGQQGKQQQGEGGEPQQMSAAEAERLLEAMNANEKKFLQQVEKGKKHRTYNQDGPDW